MRHLWRMCFALFVSSIAFYLGPDRLPVALRIPAFRAAGVLLPIAAIVYWRWRLRGKRPLSSIVQISAPEAVSMVNDVILPFHVLAGILALVFGYVALFAAKGGRLHQQSRQVLRLRDGRDGARRRIDGGDRSEGQPDEHRGRPADLLFRRDRVC